MFQDIKKKIWEKIEYAEIHLIRHAQIVKATILLSSRLQLCLDGTCFPWHCI